MKSKFIIGFLFVAIFAMIGCKANKSIIGTWCVNKECSFKYVFHNDGRFEIINEGQVANISDHGSLYYKIAKENNSNLVCIIDSFHSFHKQLFRFKYQFDGFDLLAVFYKDGFIDMNDDIDEIARLKRVNYVLYNSTKYSSPRVFQTYYLPKDFSGRVFIVYEGQKNIQNKCNKFSIPENGKLKIQFKAEPFDLLKGGMIFLTEEGDTMNQIIGTYNKNIDMTTYKEKPFVNIIGFNQRTRRWLQDSMSIENNDRDVLFLDVHDFKDFVDSNSTVH